VAIRLLLKVCLLVGIAVALEGLVFFLSGHRDVWEHSYLAGWRQKHEQLVGPGHNRIILAGGSNVAFGIDSSQVEAATQRQTINLGLHGGIGLAAIVHEVEEGVRAGDSVLLIPEYEHFYGEIMNGDRDAVNLVQLDVSALRYFSSWPQWKSLITNAHLMNRDVIFGLIEIVKTKLRGGRTEAVRETPTVYRSDAFNAYGDVVAHLDQPSKPDRVAATNNRITGPFNEQAVEAVVHCATTVIARGAEFIFVYPPVAASYWALNGDQARQVAARMPGEWTLSTPEEWVFDDRLFYDTVYHLTRAGRDQRTKKLVGMLPASLKAVATQK
jgi:hypothetical protein